MIPANCDGEERVTAIPPEELDAFRALEQRGWETTVAPYAEAFGALTAQTVVPLLDAVHAAPGVRLLDVATGPGYVAGAAAERGARVLGIDFSAAMLAVARERYPAVEFRAGDAEALDLPDASFDALACNFGVLHLSRPERALAEFHRVLRPGGRLGFTVWAPPAQSAGFRIVLEAVEQHGNPHVALPQGPPFFRYSEPAAGQQALASAGFDDTAATLVPLEWRLPTAATLFAAMQHATVRTAALLRAQTPAALAAIGAAVRDALAPYSHDGGSIMLPMAAMLHTARRPE